MYLSRYFSRLLPSPNPKIWRLLRATYHLQSSYSSGAESSSPIKRIYKKHSKSSSSSSAPAFSKPSEIPYQAKVANSVQLVGSISEPVQLHTLPDGVYALSALVRGDKHKRSPYLCIPVIFQGDLAQIAAFHLKENDLVHIAGQLSGDALPVEGSQKTVKSAHSHIQVLVNSLNFVEKTCQEKENELGYDQDNVPSDPTGSLNEPDDGAQSSWNDLIDNPHQWRDNREDKFKGLKSSKYPDFIQKNTKKALWLDTAPVWVLAKLDGLIFSGGNDTIKRQKDANAHTRNTVKGSLNEADDGAHISWNDLIINPFQWWDNREDKKKGLKSSKYPDFTQKNTKKALWLSTAPNWVSTKLDGLTFTGGNNTIKRKKDANAVHTRNTEKDNLWKSLAENPDKWWDNRSSKFSLKSPDFKHKDTGEALWLGSATPSWVFQSLPPLAKKRNVAQNDAIRKSDTLLS